MASSGTFHLITFNWRFEGLNQKPSARSDKTCKALPLIDLWHKHLVQLSHMGESLKSACRHMGATMAGNPPLGTFWSEVGSDEGTIVRLYSENLSLLVLFVKLQWTFFLYSEYVVKCFVDLMGGKVEYVSIGINKINLLRFCVPQISAETPYEIVLVHFQIKMLLAFHVTDKHARFGLCVTISPWKNPRKERV